MIKLNISKEEIDIFTDGSCSGNPGPGGWAGVIIHDLISILTGYDTNTTNSSNSANTNGNNNTRSCVYLRLQHHRSRIPGNKQFANFSYELFQKLKN